MDGWIDIWMVGRMDDGWFSTHRKTGLYFKFPLPIFLRLY